MYVVRLARVADRVPSNVRSIETHSLALRTILALLTSLISNSNIDLLALYSLNTHLIVLNPLSIDI